MCSNIELNLRIQANGIALMQPSPRYSPSVSVSQWGNAGASLFT